MILDEIKVGDAVVCGVNVHRTFKPLYKGTVKKIWDNFAEVSISKEKTVMYALTSVRKA